MRRRHECDDDDYDDYDYNDDDDDDDQQRLHSPLPGHFPWWDLGFSEA